MRVWITKVSYFNLNTRTRVKLHANACNYKISKFYTQLITRTVHSLSTHCPRTGHEYYTQTTRILRACRCCNPFDGYCSWVDSILMIHSLQQKIVVIAFKKNMFSHSLWGWLVWYVWTGVLGPARKCDWLCSINEGGLLWPEEPWKTKRSFI